MIASNEDIREIILTNPNKDLVSKGVAYSKRLRMHLYGIGLSDHVVKIEGFERETMHKVRGKYSKSNKDLFSRLSRPVDKIWTAKGGSVYYRLSSDGDNKAKQLSGDVKDGQSLKSWMRSYWQPHYLDDPFGVVLMEIMPMPEAVRAKQEGRPFVYPTYQPVTNIFDYAMKGASLDYLVLKTTKKERMAAGYKEEDIIYRFIDDAFDYWVRKVDETTIEVIESHTIPNFFGYVPGMVNSDIVDPTQDKAVLSMYDEVLEMADLFLLKGSIRLTHDFLHGFPKYWEFADNCHVCHGTMYHEGKPCNACKGTGKKIMSSISDAKVLTWPDKDSPTVPQVAGYVTPPRDYYEVSTADLTMLESLMNYTLWGADSEVKTPGLKTDSGGDTATATEVVSDMQPKADRLCQISESAERRCKFIMDSIIAVQLRPGYQGCSYSLGKRFLIESPDAIWEKYSDARIKGAAQSVMDDLLEEYYEAKYQNDPVKLEIQMKLMRVEPFVHYTAVGLKPLGATTEDFAAKLYFGEWLSAQPTGYVFVTPIDMLRKDLYEYVKEKAVVMKEELAAQQEEQKPAAV